MREGISSPKHAGLLALTVALAAISLSGCVGGAEPNSSLFVKDALTDDASAVEVTFTLAQAKPEGGAWMTVFEGKETIELLSLSAADAKARLAGFDLPEGKYEGLRIAVSEVEITRLDGSAQLLNVYGNIVSISEGFTVGADGIDILVDFDLEEGVDLAAGTYTPVVADVQTSADDADEDGESDFKDDDDDQDGLKDDQDDDDDGDLEDDEPDQRHGANTADLCEAELAEELGEAQQERDEQIADAAAERDAELAEANATQQGRTQAYADYNTTVADLQTEYDHEVAEANDEKVECLSDDEDSDQEDENDASEVADDDGGDDADETESEAASGNETESEGASSNQTEEDDE